MESVFECEKLTVCYDKKPVIWDLSIQVPKGNIVAILGPNGAGKTTLLKASLGFIKPLSGKMRFFNSSLKKTRHKVAYVPQRDCVDWSFPITVLEVVLMGRFGKLGMFKWPKKADIDAAEKMLDVLGMRAFKDYEISELSGGQQQRVFLARALMQDADLYILDEPFAGIDAGTEILLFEVFNKLKSKGKTLIIVHHDLQSVKKMFDWVIIIKHSLIASGPTEEVFTTENLAKAFGKKGELLAEMLEISKKQKSGIQKTS